LHVKPTTATTSDAAFVFACQPQIKTVYLVEAGSTQDVHIEY